MKLIKFTNRVEEYKPKEYIIQNNDNIYFDFTQESNGYYFVSIYFDKLKYSLKNCKRLSENQKNIFINNYYDFINNSERGILDINNLIEKIIEENL